MVYVTGLSTDYPYASFNSALNSPTVRASDILWLTQSYYSGDAVSAILKGSSTRPIIVKPIPGLKPRISGTINTTTIQYVEFHDIEFYYNWNGTRWNYTKDNAPSRVTVVGNGIKFVNCVFHDITQVSCFSNATNTEFYGCLFFNIGIGGSDWNYVHNIYAQNGATGTKTFDSCIFLDSISQFMTHIYGESGNLKNFTIRNCILAGERIALFGGLTNLENFTFEYNFSAALIRFGYGAGTAQNNSIIRYNFFGGGAPNNIEIYSHASLTFTDNIVTSRRAFYLFPTTGQLTSSYEINRNQYSNDLGDLRFSRREPDQFVVQEWFSLASWQAYEEGHDADSTQQSTSSAYDRAIVYPNSYNNERAHIAIANAALVSFFEVDLSDINGLSVGDTVSVRNCQNYYNDIQSLVLDADKHIAVSMTNRTIASPDGEGFEVPTSLYPNIGVFVVEKS